MKEKVSFKKANGERIRIEMDLLKDNFKEWHLVNKVLHPLSVDRKITLWVSESEITEGLQFSKRYYPRLRACLKDAIGGE